MTTLKRTERVVDGRLLVAEILLDRYPPRPDVDGDREPEFFRAERGSQLVSGLKNEFGNWALIAHSRLSRGEVVKTKDGGWYYGFSEYRHGGSAFALCRSVESRRWPDQMRGVIELAGWLKVSKSLRQAWECIG